MSLAGMLYNVQLIKYAGENGIAAYGTVMYIDMIFLACFIGYAIGTGPVIGFNYGAQNHKELKSLLRKSIVVMLISGALMFVFAELMARPLAMIFSSYDQELLDMTVHGFRLYAVSFLFISLTIFGSSFFTALNNGLVSSLISVLRTLVFEVAAVLILPVFWGIDGIWLSIVLARCLAAGVTVAFLAGNKRKYHY